MKIAATAVLASAMALLGPATCVSADWALSDTQLERLDTGAVIAEADMAQDRTAADIRAAVTVHAPPEQVFRTLTDCAQAMRFVPHLKNCVVLETSHDGSWQNVEQQ